MQFPEMLASEVLNEGLENPELCDEIYIQIIKQCSRNTTRSLRKGFQLLNFVCRTFAPTQNLVPYVLMCCQLCIYMPALDRPPVACRYVDVFLFKACGGEKLSQDDVCIQIVILKCREFIVFNTEFIDCKVRS